MKRTHLLNRHVSKLVACVGHRDEITVADAGLPMPSDVQVIDLCVSPGVPGMWDVLTALKSELMVEGVVIAREADDSLVNQFRLEIEDWGSEQRRRIERFEQISHEDFKLRTANSKAVIRSGEVTPYCNIILVCGVAF